VALFRREGLVGLLSAIISGEALGRYVVLVSDTASRISVERMREVLVSRSRLRRMLAAYNEALPAQTIPTCNICWNDYVLPLLALPRKQAGALPRHADY